MQTGGKAAIYVRISQDRSGEGLGVQRQERDCRALADREGLEVAHLLSDNDVSAYSRKARPGFTALSELVRDRKVDCVIAWSQDRLARQPKDFYELMDLCESKGKRDPGVRVYTTTASGSGLLDFRTASGGLSAGMAVLMAEYESKVKRDRAEAKARQKAEAGEWLGGTRPFGWNVEGKHLVLNEREAEAVRAACRDLLAGRSLGSIIRDWNNPERDGGPMPTTLGKPWTYATLRQVMLRERNTGRLLFEVEGSAPIVMECPPLVSQTEFDSVRALLQDKTRRRSTTNKARHLLAGIAQCHCGELVKSKTATGRRDKDGNLPKRKVYACPAKGPGHVGKRVEYVDTLVELRVWSLVTGDAQQRQDDPERVERLAALEAKWTDLQRRKDEAGRALADGTLTLGQLAQFNRSVDAQLDRVQRELDGLGATVAPLGDTSEALLNFTRDTEAFRAWRRQPIDDRREFIRSRLHVVLFPHDSGWSRQFDTSTVRVYPRTLEERGRTLTAEEVASRPATPLVADAYAPLDDDSATWEDYLTAFMHHSGQGFPSGFDRTYADSREGFTPHWRPLEGDPWAGDSKTSA